MSMPIIRNKRRKVPFIAGVFLMVSHQSISYSVNPEDKLLSKIVQKQETTLIAAQPDQRAIELDKLVQSITTVTEFLGEQEERNRGSGFVVGNYFFTVHHNLTTSFPSLRVKSTSFIDGISVTQPIFASEDEDVAIFDLPDRLCAKHCNNTEVAYSPDLSRSRKVYWLRKFQEDFILKEAKILGSVTFGDVNTPSVQICGSSAVVLVDQPFIPGSSGSPIMDAETGKIIGVIQGSVDKDGVSKGYFKPINCVVAMLEDSRSVQSIAGL